MRAVPTLHVIEPAERADESDLSGYYDRESHDTSLCILGVCLVPLMPAMLLGRLVGIFASDLQAGMVSLLTWFGGFVVLGCCHAGSEASDNRRGMGVPGSDHSVAMLGRMQRRGQRLERPSPRGPIWA